MRGETDLVESGWMQQPRGRHQFERCLLEVATVRLLNAPAAGRPKQMGGIASLVGIGPERAQTVPLRGFVPCFLEQLAASRA